MAMTLQPGLTPAEVAFICEMELVTVIPRQKLDTLELLGGPTTPLVPPFPTPLPLWLALLLKRQRRANILPPPWLTTPSLSTILDTELSHPDAFSPSPTLPPSTTLPSSTYLSPSSTSSYSNDLLDPLEFSPPFLSSACTTAADPDALPYCWLEISHILLSAAPDDFDDADGVRRLLRDLREVRMAKLRKGTRVLEGGAGVQMNGVGGMEIAEARAFVTGVVDGLRKLGASREQARREGEDDDDGDGYDSRRDDDDDDEDLL